MHPDSEKYAWYTLQDFLLDEYFQQWVRHPDPETNAFWEACLLHPRQRETIGEARQILLDLAFRTDVADPESQQRVWQRIQAANQSQTHEPVVSDRFRLSFRSWQRVAAVFIGLIVAAGIFLVTTRTHQPLEYRTAYGEIKQINLPDGSRVTLNANSFLRVSPSWNEQSPRQVWLEGEAVFSVTHTANHQRFVVHLTDTTAVEVLGTVFNAFHRDRGNRVVLTSGKVRLTQRGKSQTQELILKPGEMATQSLLATQFAKTAVRPADFSAWTEKKLVFNQLPLSEVLVMLEETYGLHITVADSSLLQKKIWGSAPMEDEDVVLAGLSRTFGWQFSRDGKRVILRAAK